jgi:hypothetical protein
MNSTQNQNHPDEEKDKQETDIPKGEQSRPLNGIVPYAPSGWREEEKRRQQRMQFS